MRSPHCWRCRNPRSYFPVPLFSVLLRAPALTFRDRLTVWVLVVADSNCLWSVINKQLETWLEGTKFVETEQIHCSFDVWIVDKDCEKIRIDLFLNYQLLSSVNWLSLLKSTSVNLRYDRKYTSRQVIDNSVNRNDKASEQANEMLIDFNWFERRFSFRWWWNEVLSVRERDVEIGLRSQWHSMKTF